MDPEDRGRPRRRKSEGLERLRANEAGWRGVVVGEAGASAGDQWGDEERENRCCG